MQTKDLEIIKGFDQTYSLAFSDGVGVIDISQWITFYTIKEQKSTTVLINKTITNHTDPINGLSKITLTKLETNIKRGVYKYLISVQTGAGELYPIIAGTINVKEV